MKTKMVFKLLRDIDDRLWSWSPPNQCSQEYFYGKVNRPKIPQSGIFVFDTLEEALQFDKSAPCRAVFECEATGVRKRTTRMMINARFSDVVTFWKNWRKISLYRRTAVSPKVSICDTLKILRRVQ